MLIIRAVVEYNENGFLVHAENYVGAFTRGRTKDEAFAKFEGEMQSYLFWATGDRPPQNEPIKVEIAQEKLSTLQICDADSDVIFEAERMALNPEEYTRLKTLAIKSARDFERLYLSIPDKNQTGLKARQTFYGPVPRTANEIYEHTNNVTNYYVGEIGVVVSNLPSIVDNRLNALAAIEATPHFLRNTVYDGSYGEQWPLRKVLRRFIWHDRIHAKAMYRMAIGIWGKENLQNPFCFDKLNVFTSGRT